MNSGRQTVGFVERLLLLQHVFVQERKVDPVASAAGEDRRDGERPDGVGEVP